jgi:hypothetical protein
MAIALEKAKELYDKVQAKKSAIEKAEKGKFETDGMFRYSHSGAVMDIKTEKSKTKLVEVYAFLLEREEKLTTAAKELGVETEKTWLGAPISSWKEDLKIAANRLSIAKQKAELNKMEETLKMVSPDLLSTLEIENIEKALSESK